MPFITAFIEIYRDNYIIDDNIILSSRHFRSSSLYHHAPHAAIPLPRHLCLSRRAELYTPANYFDTSWWFRVFCNNPGLVLWIYFAEYRGEPFHIGGYATIWEAARLIFSGGFSAVLRWRFCYDMKRFVGFLDILMACFVATLAATPCRALISLYGCPSASHDILKYGHSRSPMLLLFIIMKAARSPGYLMIL